MDKIVLCTKVSEEFHRIPTKEQVKGIHSALNRLLTIYTELFDISKMTKSISNYLDEFSKRLRDIYKLEKEFDASISLSGLEGGLGGIKGEAGHAQRNPILLQKSSPQSMKSSELTLPKWTRYWNRFKKISLPMISWSALRKTMMRQCLG